MNLYEILGIAIDATADQIKAAYRLLVKKHHPDAGGDRELFERIQFAYDTLSDPEMRQRYDKTGHAYRKVEANPDAPALKLLAQMVDELLNQHSDWSVDFLTELRRGIDIVKMSTNSDIAAIESRKAAAERTLEKIQRKADSGSVLETMLARQIEHMEHQLEGGNQHLSNLVRCEELVSAYSLRPGAEGDPFTRSRLLDMVEKQARRIPPGSIKFNFMS